MIEFTSLKVPISYIHIGNESLITRGRNTMISYFYNMGDQYDTLLFMDADIYLPAAGLARMLNHNADVLGVAVPLKGFDAQGKRVFNVSGNVKPDVQTGLVEVDRVGTAVLMLSREAVTALVEDAKKNHRVYKGNPLTRGEKQLDDNYDIFQVGVVGNTYLSEDYWVCNKLRELGFKVLVDPAIPCRHSGMYTWGTE